MRVRLPPTALTVDRRLAFWAAAYVLVQFVFTGLTLVAAPKIMASAWVMGGVVAAVGMLYIENVKAGRRRLR